MEQFKELIAQILPIVIAFVSTMAAVYFKKFVEDYSKKLGIQVKSENEKEAVQVIMSGMAKAQDELIRAVKTPDKKLAPDVVEQAKTIAYNHAVEIAKGPIKDIILEWGRTRIDSIIKQKLQEFKK